MHNKNGKVKQMNEFFPSTSSTSFWEWMSSVLVQLFLHFRTFSAWNPWNTHTHIPLFHVIKQSPNFSLPLLWKFIQLQPRTGLVIIIKCIWCGIQTQIVRGYIVEVFWNEEKVTCVCVCMSNFLLDNILNTYWYIC